MAEPTLILPEKVRLRLTDVSGRTVALANVLFRVRAFSRRKNNFDLLPFSTDSQGTANISRWELMAQVSAEYDSGLMDYCSIDECYPEVEISVLTNDEIQRAIQTRTTIWKTLLNGERDRWRTHAELVELYRSATNSQIQAKSLRAEWDGSHSEYEYLVVADVAKC
jgi:hypothetical protein